MEIYQATMADLERVAQLFDAYRVFYRRASNLQAARVFMKERLEKEDSIIYIAKKNEEYIGFVQLYPTYSSVMMKRVWILNDLYTKKEARGQGVGSRLLAEAKNLALKTEAGMIQLRTEVNNTVAKRLYKRHGYKKDTVFDHYELRLD